MSFRLMNAVWQLQLRGSHQHIMLALASHARDDGSRAFPGVDYLAWKTGYSERQVQRVLRILEARGLIRPVSSRRGGRGCTTEYCIDLSQAIPKQPFIRSPEDHPRPDQADEKGDILSVKGDILSEKGDILSPKYYINQSEKSLERSVTIELNVPSDPQGNLLSNLSNPRAECGTGGIETKNPMPGSPTRQQPSAGHKRHRSHSTGKAASGQSPPSEHRELMEFLGDQNGPIPNGGAEGKALQWMLERYTKAEILACYWFLRRQRWRHTAITWLTVRREIGPWSKGALRLRPDAGSAVVEPEGDAFRAPTLEQLAIAEKLAVEDVAAALKRAGIYERHMEALRRQDAAH